MIRLLTSLNCRSGKLSIDSENHSLGAIWCQRCVHNVQCVLFLQSATIYQGQYVGAYRNSFPCDGIRSLGISGNIKASTPTIPRRGAVGA